MEERGENIKCKENTGYEKRKIAKEMREIKVKERKRN
jgi:exosome complex RNA-binding protein Csl4